ncbi:MAG: ECF-type sigma factor [Vicinamibacterales bacterium]
MYTQLRARARRHLRHEHAALTLQTTALVHEACLRLTRAEDHDWHDRVHLLRSRRADHAADPRRCGAGPAPEQRKR